MTDRNSRPALLAAMAEFASAPTTLAPVPGAGAPHRLLDQPFGDDVELGVLGLADPGEPLERLVARRRRTGCG